MTTDDMRREFEAWYCKEYGDMFPLARWTAEGDYHSPKAVKHWKTWQAAYTRPVPAGVVEEWNPDAVLARIQTMECDHKVGATNSRTKADEWEACYALLFKHLQEIVKAHAQPAAEQDGEVAHRSEQSTHNGLADGSIPSLPTKNALAIARSIARPAKELALNALVIALPAIEYLLKECTAKQPVRVDVGAIAKRIEHKFIGLGKGLAEPMAMEVARAVLSVVKDAAKEMGVELEIV